MNFLAEHRIKHRADRKGQALVEGKKGQCQTDHSIHRPGMKSPVQKGQVHGRFGSLGSTCFGERITDKVEHRLGYTVKQQADPHTGTEEHCEPAHRRELRLGIRAAEANIPVPAHHQYQNKYQDDVHCHDKQPSGTSRNSFLNRRKNITNTGLKQNSDHYRTDYYDC